MFNKSEDLFPIRRGHVYMAHSSVGPMYGPAATAGAAFLQAHSEQGMMMRVDYGSVLTTFRQKVAALLETSPNNIAYVSNTAEGTNMVANGYPFEPGDQVISYVHEFPSNHYPWLLQQRRGVELVLLSDVDPCGGLPEGGPRGWSMDELEAKTTDRTRVIALSHVQFASGYAADLRELGDFCRERGIDLVIDAAQSLGVLPLHPEEYGIAAVTGSTWKWLLASRGAGIFYTTPDLREKLRDTMAGGGMMKHRLDYLNHSWDPFESARRFEYSTLPWEHLVTLETVLDEVFLKYLMGPIAREVFRLQDRFLALLDTDRYEPLLFPREHRSGILAFRTAEDPKLVSRALAAHCMVTTTQGGYLRVAPHFYLTDEDIRRAAAAFNQVGIG